MADVYKKISEYNELAELDASGKMLVAQSDETYSVGADTMADFVKGRIPMDATPTQGSSNPVTSNGVYNGIRNYKISDRATTQGLATSSYLLIQDGSTERKITAQNHFDAMMLGADRTPTSGSRRAVWSGGVYDAIEEVRALTETDDTLSVEDKPADAKVVGESLVARASLKASYAETIPNGTDYNTITTPGNYIAATNSAAQSMTNSPTTSAHRLFVMGTIAGRCVQLVFANSATVPEYRRFYNGSSWGEWHRTAYRDDIPQVDDSLTIQGAAADAKSVGDAVREVYDGTFDVQDIIVEFEQGNLSSSNGGITYSNFDIRLRTAMSYYCANGLSFTVPEGYRVYLYYYNDASWDFYGTSGGWLTGNISIQNPPASYVRLVVSNVGGGAILPTDTSITIRTVNHTDTELAKQNVAADGKETGDAIKRARASSMTGVVADSPRMIEFVNGSVSSSVGGFSTDSRTRVAALLPVDGIARVTCNEGYGMQAYVYSAAVADSTCYLGRVSADGTLQKGGTPWLDYQDVWLGKLPKESKYIRLVLFKGDSTDEVDPIEDFGVTLWHGATVIENMALQADPAVWGRSNVLARASHILDIKWTPTAATMARGQTSDTYYDMTEQTGIPYSSVRDEDKAVGMNVSIRTFMTAVHDPRSVLYTRKSTTSNASTYYGTVCSGLCNYGFGLDLNLTNTWLGKSDLFETIPMQSIRAGDMLFVSGHVALVSKVKLDSWGRITSVQVREEWMPTGRTVNYSSFASFLSARNGYIARRFKGLDGVGYTAIPYVQCFDEEPAEITYPDVQTDHGDGAVFVTGETVTVHVIDPKSYTQIAVTKDGASVLTSTSITDFTIPNVHPGLYTITATGGGNESVSEFFVADVHGSFNVTTGDVTFSSSNATPVLVNTYGWPVANNTVLCFPLPLTDDDRARGSVNVSGMLTMANPQAKVTFMTPYGTADWRSEYHQTWEAIT